MSSDDTAPGRIDGTWVVQAAARLGLDIPAERLPGVVATLQRIEDVARIVNEVPLAADDEPAPVWRP